MCTNFHASITNWSIMVLFCAITPKYTGKTPENNDWLTNAKLVIPLKYLSNFWRSLNIPLIHYKVELILAWSKNCVFSDMTTRNAQRGNPAIVAPSGATFKITDTKLYFPVVILSKENDTKLLGQLQKGFKKQWNGVNTDHKWLFNLKITT